MRNFWCIHTKFSIEACIEGLEFLLRILILRVKIGSVAKSRNSDTFRRSRTKSSFPIAIASKLLQYGCCTSNFVGVLNTAHWPICAVNISQKKNICGFWDAGLGPQWTVADSHMGPEKMKLGETQSPLLFGFWGLWERPTTPRRPVPGTNRENFRF
jgi:hypothetical protein